MFFDFYFETDPGVSIELGATISGEISSLAELDIYTFDGIVNDRVLLRASDVPDSQLEPEMQIYSVDGTLLCSTWGYVLAEMVCTLDTTNTYTLLVGDRGGNALGDYTLYLQRPNNPANPLPINFDDTVANSISEPPAMKTYTFSGNVNDRVLLRASDAPDSLFEVEMRVYRPDGTQLCSTWGYVLAEIVCTLDVAGGYTLMIGERGGDTIGDYTLYLQRTNDPANVTLMDYGDTLTGTITSDVELNAYGFAAETDQSVWFSVMRTSGNLDPQFRVYRPDGALLCQAQTTGGLIEDVCLLDVSGDYAILVGDWGGDETGSYEIQIALSP